MQQKAIEPAATTELVPGDLKTEQVDANEPVEKEKEIVEEKKEEEEDDENAGLSLMEIHKKKIDKGNWVINLKFCNPINIFFKISFK